MNGQNEQKVFSFQLKTVSYKHSLCISSGHLSVTLLDMLDHHALYHSPPWD